MILRAALNTVREALNEEPVADPPPAYPAPPPSPIPAAPPAPDEVMGVVEEPARREAITLDIDALQGMTFPPPVCWSLVSHVYALAGADPASVQTVSESMRLAARAFRLTLHKRAFGLRQIAQPVDLAIVLMWPTAKRRAMHCGIYWNGCVLHATPDGVLYQDLRTLRGAYPFMEFWA